MVKNSEEKLNIRNDFKLDDSNRVPYYYQLKQYIIQEIESGNWKPKQMLPYENELCIRFDVSRTVVRQALQELKNDGYINTRKGKGTFVAEPKVNENILQNILGFHELWKSQGLKVENIILELESIKAPDDVAKILKLKPEDKVIFLKRLVKLDNVPYSIMTNYIPYSLEPGLLKEDYRNTGLTSVMERKYGIEFPYGISTIELTFTTEEESKFLKVKKGTPLFLFYGTNFSSDNIPIVYFKIVIISERSRIKVDMVQEKSFGKGKGFKIGSATTGVMVEKTES